jgi:DNA polymerase type B, organellar and viral
MSEGGVMMAAAAPPTAHTSGDNIPSLSEQEENNLFYSQEFALNSHANQRNRRNWRPQNGFLMSKSSFKNRIRDYILENEDSININEIKQYLTSVRDKVLELMNSFQRDFKAFKVQFMINALFSNTMDVCRLYNFKTTMIIVLKNTDLDDMLCAAFEKLELELEELSIKGSGFTVSRFIDFCVYVNKYEPPSAAKYFPLPKKIADKKAIVSVQNTDEFCFKYAMLSKFVNRNPQTFQPRVYKKLDSKYDWTDVNFPADFKDIKTFLRNNQNCSINLFELGKDQRIFPVRVMDEKEDHRDLLIQTRQNSGSHYSWIKNFDKLFCTSLSKYNGKKFLCKKCFCHFGTEVLLNTHRPLCLTEEYVIKKFPKPGTKIKFESINCMEKTPFCIFFDFESAQTPFLHCDPDEQGPWNLRTSLHDPIAYGLYVFTTLPLEFCGNVPLGYHSYSGPKDVGKHFFLKISEIVAEIAKVYKNNLPMVITNEQIDKHESAKNCHYCNVQFDDILITRVKHHCHLTGQFQNTACIRCNNNLRNPTVNIFCHNLNYDLHFFLRHLNCKKGKVNLLSKSLTKFISLQKFIHGVKVKFLCSLRLLPASLDKLAKAMPKSDFKVLQQIYGDKYEMLTEKLIFPYDLVTTYDSLLEITEPPAKELFYNTLTQKHCLDSEYALFLKIWEEFDIKDLHSYMMLYLKIDVILGMEIVCHARETFFEYYKLDLLSMETLSRFAYNACLLRSRAQVECLTDASMYDFFRRAFRGGSSFVSKRYSIAQNEYVGYESVEEILGEPLGDTQNQECAKAAPNNANERETSFIENYDMNALYPGIISQFKLPVGEFICIKHENIDIKSLDPYGDYNYLIECDIKVPSSVHKSHDQFPFFPEHKCAPGSKIKKLLLTLEDKKNYVCLLNNLQQGMDHGLILEKVHKIVRFRQSFWLKEFIDENNSRRANSTDEASKNLFKLVSNATYGRFCMAKEKHRDVYYVNDEKYMNKLVKKFNFANRAILDDETCLVEMRKRSVVMNTLFPVAVVILELSKTKMYDFYYVILRGHFGAQNLSCLGGDTDSIWCQIKTKDIYDDMIKLKKYFDTSNFPPDHKVFSLENKMKFGCFKSECPLVPIKAFVGLRSKVYAFLLKNKSEVRKCKGTGRSAISSLRFKQYRKCLMDRKPVYATFSTIQAIDYNLYTIKNHKKALCALDDKRIVLEDQINTVAYGNCHINLR